MVHSKLASTEAAKPSPSSTPPSPSQPSPTAVYSKPTSAEAVMQSPSPSPSPLARPQFSPSEAAMQLGSVRKRIHELEPALDQHQAASSPQQDQPLLLSLLLLQTASPGDQPAVPWPAAERRDGPGQASPPARVLHVGMHEPDARGGPPQSTPTPTVLTVNGDEQLSNLSVNCHASGQANPGPGTQHRTQVSAIFDSGSPISFISSAMARRLQAATRRADSP